MIGADTATLELVMKAAEAPLTVMPLEELTAPIPLSWSVPPVIWVAPG